MKSLDEIIDTPRAYKTKGFSHSDSKYILKIPYEARSSQAIEILLKQHSRLAYKVAFRIWKKYKGKIGAVIDFEDLLSAATEGLLIAIKRYSPTYNAEFSTFAVNWIYQRAKRELDQNFCQVRIPIHFLETTGRVLKGYEKKDNNQKLSKLVMHRFYIPFSLESVESDSEVDLSFNDIVTYENMFFMYSRSGYFNPEQNAINQDLRDRVNSLINQITSPRNRVVIKRRFGLDDYGSERTLDEVGKEFNLTRERIRQLCNKAFKRVNVSEYVNEEDLFD